MEDVAFSKFVQNPRKFFRAILPGISKSLDRILIRIFCLDPAKRITLDELRNMILHCRSFTAPVKPPSQLEISSSFESTVMAYIGDYTDLSSSHHSDITDQDPPTPRNGSPVLNSVKQEHYFYEHNNNPLLK